MNIKRQQIHNYQQLNLKNKNAVSKQIEQEQNHRNGDHMEGYQWKGEEGKWRKIGTTITEQQLEKKISFIKKMRIV